MIIPPSSGIAKNLFLGYLYFFKRTTLRFRRRRSSRWMYVFSHSSFFIHVLICVLFFPAKLLLTPFRSQNIPPPLSSYQLALSPDLPGSLLAPKPTAPIHVNFSAENDDLAILWESGYFEIWTLNMRLVPGSAKTMDPTKFLGGFAQTEEKKSGIRWRQILLRSNDASGKSFTVTVIGAGPGDQSDTITVSTVQEGVTTGTIDYPLPYRNCRLVIGDICQSPDGELFRCMSDLFFSRFAAG